MHVMGILEEREKIKKFKQIMIENVQIYKKEYLKNNLQHIQGVKREL